MTRRLRNRGSLPISSPISSRGIEILYRDFSVSYRIRADYPARNVLVFKCIVKPQKPELGWGRLCGSGENDV